MTSRPLLVLGLATAVACSSTGTTDALVAPDQGADGGAIVLDDRGVPVDPDGDVIDAELMDPDGGEPPDQGVPDLGPPDLGPDTGLQPSRAVFEHRANGDVVSGATVAVSQAILHHGDLKVGYRDWILRCTDASTVAAGASCQAWLPVNVVDEGPHWAIPDNPEWAISTFNTSGLVDHARYRADRHQLTSNQTEDADLRWFVRDWRTERYAWTRTGSAAVGARADLLADLRAGAFGTPFRTTRPGAIRINGVHVAALQPYLLELTPPSARGREITDDATQILRWIDTAGGLFSSRWSFAEHVPRGTTATTTPGAWWMEPGWGEVYAHSSTGALSRGTLAALVDDASAGADVVVQVGPDLILPCSRVVISPDETVVTCLVRDSFDSVVERANVRFTADPGREVRSITTRGVVVTDRYRFGGMAPFETRTEQFAVRWFSNRAGWSELFVTGTRGTPIAGNVNRIVEAAEAGADVRLMAVFGNDTVVNSCHALKVDRARGRVGCLDFGTRPGVAYWYFGIHSTDGVLRDYRVCSGTVSNCGALTQTPDETHWFVRW